MNDVKDQRSPPFKDPLEITGVDFRMLKANQDVSEGKVEGQHGEHDLRDAMPEGSRADHLDHDEKEFLRLTEILLAASDHSSRIREASRSDLWRESDVTTKALELIKRHADILMTRAANAVVRFGSTRGR